MLEDTGIFSSDTPFAAGGWSFLGSGGFGSSAYDGMASTGWPWFLPRGKYMASSGRTGFRAGSGRGGWRVRGDAYVMFRSSFEALLVRRLASRCGGGSRLQRWDKVSTRMGGTQSLEARWTTSGSRSAPNAPHGQHHTSRHGTI